MLHLVEVELTCQLQHYTICYNQIMFFLCEVGFGKVTIAVSEKYNI